MGMKAEVVSRTDITLGRLLGSGAFGVVHLAAVEGWTRPVVSKVVKPKKMAPKDADLFKNEICIWSNLDHPNCVRLLAVALEPDEFSLLSELCSGGSMDDRIAWLRKHKKPMPTMVELSSMMLQMARAMAYLHRHGVMHRDLKSGNILLSGEGESLFASGPLKIADFGLARHLPAEDRSASLTAETGSYRWMAPEVIRHEPYNSACDVYSFAVVCWEMLTYDVPFASVTAVQAAFNVAVRDRRPELPSSCSAAIAKLVTECWHADAKQRPSFAQISARLVPPAPLAPLGFPPVASAPTHQARQPSASANSSSIPTSASAGVSIKPTLDVPAPLDKAGGDKLDFFLAPRARSPSPLSSDGQRSPPSSSPSNSLPPSGRSSPAEKRGRADVELGANQECALSTGNPIKIQVTLDRPSSISSGLDSLQM